MPRIYRKRSTTEATLEATPEVTSEHQEPVMTDTTDTIASVRIRTGGVHYSGARIISLLTTDPTVTSVAANNVIICDLIRWHPAGVMFVASARDGGGTFVIPHNNIEIVTLA